MRALKTLLIPILGSALFGVQVARAQEPVTIRVGWIVPITSIAPILFAKKGIAKYEGKTYKLQFTRFRGSTPQISALATGDLDFGLLGFTSLPLAIENAHLNDLRVVIDELRVGSKGYDGGVYVVRKDSKIKKVSDLKGKVLATNAYGSARDLAMRIELLKHHIDPKTDVNIVEAPFATMKTMLLSHKADLVPAVLPFEQNPELKSKSRTLFTQRDAMDDASEQEIWVARKGFLDKNRAAVIDFMSDYLRALRFYLDPKNHEEAVQIAAKFSKLPPKVFESWVFTHKDNYRPADGVPQSKILQHNIDVLHKYGFLKQSIDVSKYVDPSFMEEAAKRLK